MGCCLFKIFYRIPSSVSFFPVNSEADLNPLYDSLKQFAETESNGTLQVYWKDQFPTHYRWRNSRIGPLVVESSPNFNYIWYGSLANFSSAHNRPRFGSHGSYSDAIEMRPFFVAYGPAFKEGFRVPDPFPNIDIYNLMCAVLGLDPAPNEGSMVVVEKFLKETTIFRDFSAPIVSTFSVIL